MELKFEVLSEKDVNTRVDKFLFEEIETLEEYTDCFSRTKIQDLIQDNCLTKNGVICDNNSYRVQLNDVFVLKLKKDYDLTLIPKEIPLDIVYEDDDLAIINKQAGLTTHPGAGNYDNTLVNALLYYYKDNLSTLNGFLRPGIVHRLDKDTSGLMVIAKNDFAHNILAKQIAEHSIKRIYNAVIWGNIFPLEGKIEGYINRCKNNRLKMEMTQNTGKYSLTNYKTLKLFGNIASLIECKLETGRTHQIRVHFSTKKHPLIGDPIYCQYFKEVASDDQEVANIINNFSRQALHSKTIQFVHPRTNKEMFFEIDLPEDMKKLIDALNKLTTNTEEE